MSGPLILGLETSCDETAAAVLEAPAMPKGHVIHSQDAHALHGGVVPELAARAPLPRHRHALKVTLPPPRGRLPALAGVAVPGRPGRVAAGHTGSGGPARRWNSIALVLE